MERRAARIEARENGPRGVLHAARNEECESDSSSENSEDSIESDSDDEDSDDGEEDSDDSDDSGKPSENSGLKSLLLEAYDESQVEERSGQEIALENEIERSLDSTQLDDQNDAGATGETNGDSGVYSGEEDVEEADVTEKEVKGKKEKYYLV